MISFATNGRIVLASILGGMFVPVGFVWVVRRSLRLLTLLTLMASALCSGQTLAAQDIASVDAALQDRPTASAVTGFAASLQDRPTASAVTGLAASQHRPAINAVASPTETKTWVAAPDSGVIASTIPLSSIAVLPILVAPAAIPPQSGDFSPRAERAPPRI